MKAKIDIENSKTKKVITLNVDVIKYEHNEEVIFDISKLNDSEINILNDAIDEKLTYTDIEMFFIDDNNIPEFGPDYKCTIENNKLILKYIFKNNINKIEEKNYDWTLDYEEEFNKIVNIFLKTDYEYLLIYDYDGIKYEFFNNEPSKTIFVDLFYDKNYKKIALFKKNIDVNTNNIRERIDYINSFSDDDERRFCV